VPQDSREAGDREGAPDGPWGLGRASLQNLPLLLLLHFYWQILCSLTLEICERK